MTAPLSVIAAVVVASGREVLLVRRSNGLWDLPSAPLTASADLQGAVRALVENLTGAVVTIDALVGIYARARPVLHLAFRGQQVGGQINFHRSLRATRWVDVDHAQTLTSIGAAAQLHDAFLPAAMWPVLGSAPAAGQGLSPPTIRRDRGGPPAAGQRVPARWPVISST